MIKLITFLGLLLSFNSFANEEKNQDKAYMSYCTHSGPGVSYFFQSCVNSNFSTVVREIGGHYSYCMNGGNEVDYFFVSCINSNFSTAQRQLNNTIYVQYCTSSDRTTLDYFFQSCVNSNFNRIQRAIDQQ